MLTTILLLIAYFCGSICSAVIISRLFSLPDPRLSGSNNPGATNVLRLAGKKYAALVLVMDMLKGLLPVILAKLLNAEPAVIAFTCFAAVMGHIYPLFFGFNGGKGFATAIGALTGLHLFLGVLIITTWLLILNFSRYVSLASILTISIAPFYALVTTKKIDVFLPTVFIGIFVVYQHRTNIKRLVAGKEPKVNLNRKTFREEIKTMLNDEKNEPK